MLDLIRLSPKLLFPPGGRALYRQIGLLADLSEGDELLVAGSANGVTVQYFVTEYGAQGSGVDFDDAMVAGATERARARDLSDRLQYQQAPLDQLPYRDGIFDVVLGELGLTARADPEEAIHELVRVARPGGRIVMVQLVWKAPVDEARRRVLGEHLGVRPLMLVEWKRILREAGLERLHIEDWTDEQTAFRPRIAKPFPDFAELFSLPEKIGILRRAWQRWGWSSVGTVISREREVHKLLTQERILGLTLVTGVKTERAESSREEAGAEDEAPGSAPGTSLGSGPPDGGETESSTGAESSEAEETVEPGGSEAKADPESAAETADATEEALPAERHGETRGLPLFGHRDENG